MSNDLAGKIMFAIFSVLPWISGLYVYFTLIYGQSHEPDQTLAGLGLAVMTGFLFIVVSILPSLIISVVQVVYCILARRRGRPIDYYVFFTLIAALPLFLFIIVFTYFDLTYQQHIPTCDETGDCLENFFLKK